jgi:hypothetical protein
MDMEVPNICTSKRRVAGKVVQDIDENEIKRLETNQIKIRLQCSALYFIFISKSGLVDQVILL